MKKAGKILAYVLAGTSFVLSRLLPFHGKSPRGMSLMIPKMIAQAVAGFISATGLVGALLGIVFKARRAVVLGFMGQSTSARYIWRVIRSSGDFDRAFGPRWQEKLPPERTAHMLKGRWTWLIPRSPEPRWERNVPFYKVPQTGREVLCDIWQPPGGTEPSGLAFIYFHGSAWHYLDKDTFTRPYFRHLAAQGHVVMDVAYRLCPEVEIKEMLGDVKRAIVWMKRNALRYGVSPQRIVVAGGSAGGHLALLAAYTVRHPELTPDDLKGEDTSVLGVVSAYGPVDLHPMYSHLLDHMGREKKATENKSEWPFAKLSSAYAQKMLDKQKMTMYSGEQMFVHLLGGAPTEVPEMYDLASPITHISTACPPTLLMQGEYDSFVPVKATREMYGRLLDAGVQAVYVEFPQTEHGFDLPFPRVSPPAQVALYETERFLALLATKELPEREHVEAKRDKEKEHEEAWIASVR